MKRLIGVAVLVSAMAGCGAGDLDTTDGSAWGAFSGNLPTIEDAPRIEVVTAPEPGGSRSHEALTDDEEPATHDAVSEHNEEHDESPDAEVDGTDETSPAADDPTAHHDPTADEETASDHAPASGDEGAESDHDEGVEADQPETADDDGYVVEVTMLEFGYELDRETVPVGEPVTFRFVNDGQIEHEVVRFGASTRGVR